MCSRLSTLLPKDPRMLWHNVQQVEVRSHRCPHGVITQADPLFSIAQVNTTGFTTATSGELYISCEICEQRFVSTRASGKNISAVRRNCKEHQRQWEGAGWKDTAPVKELIKRCRLPASARSSPRELLTEILVKVASEAALPAVVRQVLARLLRDDEALQQVARDQHVDLNKAMEQARDEHLFATDSRTRTTAQKYWSVLKHCLHQPCTQPAQLPHSNTNQWMTQFVSQHGATPLSEFDQSTGDGYLSDLNLGFELAVLDQHSNTADDHVMTLSAAG